MTKPIFMTSTFLALTLLAGCGGTPDSADEAEQVTIAADTANPEIATAGEAVPVVDVAAVANPVSSTPAPAPEPARSAPTPETSVKAAKAGPTPAPAPAEPVADSGTPPVAATDPSCPPEHAAMGHCTPRK